VTCHPALWLALVLIGLLILAGHIGGALAVMAALAGLVGLIGALWRRNSWR
jgi:hypothetical protein